MASYAERLQLVDSLNKQLAQATDVTEHVELVQQADLALRDLQSYIDSAEERIASGATSETNDLQELSFKMCLATVDERVAEMAGCDDVDELLKLVSDAERHLKAAQNRLAAAEGSLTRIQS